MVKKKILLIDDDRDFGLLFTNFFIGKDFNVLLAYNLREGMEALEQFRPEFIFLDNGLPDGQGWAKADFILAEYPLAQLNLISAWTADSPSGKARILEKPINMTDLMACFQPGSGC